MIIIRGKKRMGMQQELHYTKNMFIKLSLRDGWSTEKKVEE